MMQDANSRKANISVQSRDSRDNSRSAGASKAASGKARRVDVSHDRSMDMFASDLNSVSGQN